MSDQPPTVYEMCTGQGSKTEGHWWYLVSALALPSNFREWGLPELRAWTARSGGTRTQGEILISIDSTISTVYHGSAISPYQ
jgi:hypothetical protein